jgi:excisionase family DNA binding protein
MVMLLTVKDLSAWLKMKPSTLYLWAAQGKIPCRKIHGLIRFDQEEIRQWLASFAPARGRELSLSSPHQAQREVERLIAAAKRDVYTPARETRPRDKKGVSPDGSV